MCAQPIEMMNPFKSPPATHHRNNTFEEKRLSSS